MSIRELVAATMEEVSNYRYPNTSEFRTVINPILKATGANELLDSDRIEGMDIDEDALNISFSYSRMQCEMSADRHLPLSVLDAEDPVAAATAWRLDQAVATAEKAHAEALRKVERATLSLEKAKAERGDIATPLPDSGRDAALEEAAKVVESHELAEKLARMTMSNPVSHAISLTRTIAAAIRALAAHPAPSSDAEPLDSRAAFESAYIAKKQGGWPNSPLDEYEIASFLKRDAQGDYITAGREYSGWKMAIAAHPANGAQAGLSDIEAWSPTVEQFKDWCERHDMRADRGDHREMFDDAATLYLAAAKKGGA